MKNIPFKGILAVGSDQRTATENYRLLALGQDVAAFRDEGGTLSFISNSSSSPRVMFNPHDGRANIERDDSLIASMDFVSESSTEVATAMYAECSGGCGSHFVFDKEADLKFCPICTCSVSSETVDNTADAGSTSDEDEATKLLDGIGPATEIASESSEDEDEDEDEDYDSDDGDDYSEDDMSLEDDVEEALSSDDGDESDEGDESESESTSIDSGSKFTVVASVTRQGALQMFLNAPGVSISSGQKQDVEYVVCSSAECGAHIMHNAPSLTQCPACLSAVAEPTGVEYETFNLNQLNAEQSIQVESISGDDGEEDDDSDLDLSEEDDTDDDESDGDDDSEDDSTSESSSMKTATSFSKAGAMARFREINLPALVSTSSEGGLVQAEYVVCSDANCGAHIVSASAQHFCPVCSASTEEPKSNDEAANIVGDLEIDNGEDEDGDEVDLSLDGDESESDDGEEGDDSEGDDEDLDLDTDLDSDDESDESDEGDEDTGSEEDAGEESSEGDESEDESEGETSTSSAAGSGAALAAAAQTKIQDPQADLQISALDLVNDTKPDAHTSLDVTFNPSVSSVSVWTAYYDGLPVAMARANDVPEAARELFAKPQFLQAVLATARQIGVKKALVELGFKSIVHSVPFTASLSAAVEERVAAERAQMAESTAQYADRYQAAQATAAIGINRGFFKVANPLKAALCSTMQEAGLRNPETLVDKVFATHFDQFSKSVQAKAVEIIAKPAEVQASLALAVLDVNYQSTSGAAPAVPVEEKLSTIGVSVSKDAAAIPKKNVSASSGTAALTSISSSQDFDALLAVAVGGLGNPRR